MEPETRETNFGQLFEHHGIFRPRRAACGGVRTLLNLHKIARA
jgi:hypothetical protein